MKTSFQNKYKVFKNFTNLLGKYFEGKLNRSFADGVSYEIEKPVNLINCRLIRQKTSLFNKPIFYT